MGRMSKEDEEKEAAEAFGDFMNRMTDEKEFGDFAGYFKKHKGELPVTMTSGISADEKKSFKEQKAAYGKKEIYINPKAKKFDGFS